MPSKMSLQKTYLVSIVLRVHIYDKLELCEVVHVVCWAREGLLLMLSVEQCAVWQNAPALHIPPRGIGWICGQSPTSGAFNAIYTRNLDDPSASGRQNLIRLHALH